VKGQRCYTSPPSGFGTKERGRNVQGVLEVGRKLPSALTHIVTAPLDQILKATATLARPQDALEFVLNGAVLEVDRGRSRRKSVRRVGAVRLEETRVEGVVDLAIQNGLGKIQAKRDVVDALRDKIGTGVLGHQLPGALIGVR